MNGNLDPYAPVVLIIMVLSFIFIILRSSRGLRAWIIGRDLKLFRYKIPAGASNFRVRGCGYKVETKSVITTSVFGLPIKRFLLYREGHIKPIVPYLSNPKDDTSIMTGEEFDRALGAKALQDVGKTARPPIPWRWVIYAIIGLIIMYALCSYLGIIKA